MLPDDDSYCLCLDFVNNLQARIQDSEGGVSYIQKGGGGFVQEFQERIQIVAGPWANQQAKKNCRQPWGGGVPITQNTPVSAPDLLPTMTMTTTMTRPVATGGRGGAQPPWKNLSPPRLCCPFCRNYRY